MVLFFIDAFKMSALHSFDDLRSCFIYFRSAQVELTLVLFCNEMFKMVSIVLPLDSVVEKSLGKFVDERKAKQLRDKGLPLEAAAVVAGRTDKGVTALHQVCSFCM